MSEKGSREQIRYQNRDLILSSLRREKSIARIELGKLTSLSPATVTSITADLLDLGLIEEHLSRSTDAPKGRGRPRCMLGLRPFVGCAVSIKLSVNRLHFVLCDFAGNVRARKQVRFASLEASGASFTATLVGALHEFLAEHPQESANLMEIGFAIQGIVDTQRGTIVWSPALAEKHIDVVKPIKRQFGIECYLSNDTNMIAEALYRQNPERFGPNFAVIYMDQGVGAGLIVNGELYLGETGAAAEFGHSLHIPGGALCRCGKRGCLEAYLGDYAIQRRILGASEHTDPGSLGIEWHSIASHIEEAMQGDAAKIAVFREVGFALGAGLTRLVAMLDLRSIYLTGRTLQAYPVMEAGIREGLGSSLLSNLQDEIKIDVLPWNEDLIERGVLAKALRRIDESFLARKEPMRELV